jgi:hypothetical protein
MSFSMRQAAANLADARRSRPRGDVLQHVRGVLNSIFHRTTSDARKLHAVSIDEYGSENSDEVQPANQPEQTQTP